MHNQHIVMYYIHLAEVYPVLTGTMFAHVMRELQLQQKG